MKNKLIPFALFIFALPIFVFGQAPNLGTAANFVLFSSNGAVSNSGFSQLTGHVGTNSGSSTAFGNVNGVMHDNNGTSAKAASDLLIAYNQLKSSIPTFAHSTLLGNGDTLVPGIYSIGGAATLNLSLILNAKGNANAVFIFKIEGAFSTNAASKIRLINGAKACNVFWKVEGLLSMATKTEMKGTVIVNNAAIVTKSDCNVEGRLLSTTGAVSVDGMTAYTPLGCGAATLTGPAAPDLASTECYAIFSSNGPVTNAGVTLVKGDVGTNVGLTTGFNAANVDGKIHPIPDVSTATCAADLLPVYTHLTTLPVDIELLYPAQFGNNLVLTPHTYLLNAATVLSDSLFLNAQGNANAVFVIKIQGALSTSTYAKVILINGAQAKNVYWNVNGAVSINTYSLFSGTIVCNNGAIDLKTGVTLNGRALSTTGTFTTAAVVTSMPKNCVVTGLGSSEANNSSNVVSISPNPFSNFTNITINDASELNKATLLIYNSYGTMVMSEPISKQTISISASQFSAGVYFYKIVDNEKTVQTGRLIAQQ